MRNLHAVVLLFALAAGASAACKQRPSAVDENRQDGEAAVTALPTQVAAPCPGCPNGAPAMDGVWRFEGAYADNLCTSPVATADFSACTPVDLPSEPRVLFTEPFGQRKASATESVHYGRQLSEHEVGALYRKGGGMCVRTKEVLAVTPRSCDGKRVCRTDSKGLACEGCTRFGNGCVVYEPTRAYITFFDGDAPTEPVAIVPGSKNGASIRQGAVQVNGRLPPEVIQRIVRQNFGRFRLCYENGRRTAPTLQGRVAVKFVIDRSGSVTTAQDAGSDLPDQNVVACVVRGFGNLSFPQPEGGIVVVVYPIIFNPSP